MNYTQHYQLPQWVETDRILMNDFNDAFSAIETALTASNCRLFTGTYVGTGTQGAAGRNSVTFPFPPLLAWVVDRDTGYFLLFSQGLPVSNSYMSEHTRVAMLWEGNTAEWFCSGEYVSTQQMNERNRTYYVYAVGAAD